MKHKSNHRLYNSFYQFDSRLFSYLFLLGFFKFSLVFSQSQGTIFGNVSDQFGNLPGAKLFIEGKKDVIIADIDGNYSVNLSSGDYVITAEFVMYTKASKQVTVKEGEKVQVDFMLETGFSIDEPISLGSRVQPKSPLKNTAAVDVITLQEIANSSQTELGQVLHYLIPSFHSTPQTIADGTDHIDPATLRGLGPDQVLVLINGKRRHKSSLLNVNGTVGKGSVGTDFNTIPIASIERIEILRDGAASQYGSDAIAGVINIILKKQTEVIAIDNRFGVSTEGDGFTTYSGANFGLKAGKAGYINVTAEYRKREAINRAGDYSGAVYTNDQEEDQQLIRSNNFFQQNEYSGRRVMEIGAAETQNLSLFINSEIAISDQSTFYLNGGRNYREGVSKGFYRFPKDQDKVVLELFPNGFSPEILTDIQDDAISIGVKGIRNNWNLDFSHTIGINRLAYSVNNSNNASLGIISPKTFSVGGFIYQQNTTHMDVSKTYDWLSGLNVAFGGELRVENYQITAGEEASYVDGEETYIDDSGEELPRAPGVQVLPGFRPENELNKFRTNTSAYLDMEANITSDLLLKGAARYASYNDFGDQAIWKLSGRYSFNDSISVRAGFSTGFRAPSLHQVFFQNISTQFINGESVEVGTFNNESAIVTEALGLEKLKPELSNNFNVGISGKINDIFAVIIDYYLINIKDRIVLSGRFSEGYEAIFEPFGVSSAQFLTNAIDSRTSGLDAAVIFRTQLSSGTFNTSVGFNYNITKVKGSIKVPRSLVGQEEVLFNREEIARVESAQPNYKLNSRIFYEINKFRFQLGNTLFGSVKYTHPGDGNSANWVVNEFTGNVETRDQTFAPKLVTDLEVSYQINDYVKCIIGGNNIFDVYPDKHVHSANTEHGNFIYSRRVQQFGVLGANYYVKLLLRL